MTSTAPELLKLNSNPEQPKGPARKQNVLLVRPPYFTPWTPPLGIAILKAYLNQSGHCARCFDFNADAELWGMHHKYFSVLAAAASSTSNDGYSKLWWVINAHMLAYANGAGLAAQRRVIETVSPLYGIHGTRSLVDALLPLIDRYFTRLTFLFDQLDLSSYDVIGSSTYTTSLSSSLWLLRRAKEQHPGIKTVIGGGVFADDLALGSDNLQILLNEYPWIDHIVLGEGEMLFKQILDGVLSHKRVVSLADLNGATLAMQDVPTPDFSDFSLERYYNLTIEGARSCPFQCSFCSETIQWGEYRKKPIDKFVEQVLELKSQCKMREFFMGDSLMNPYLIPFAAALTKQNADILYDGYLRADRPVTNKKFVKAWADSGLYRVRLGVESASGNVLKSMDKKTTPAVISEVLKTLSQAGIRTTTYWIVGFPGETEADFEETCEFIRNNHRYIYELEAHPYYYYPYGQVGSRLYQCESVYPDEVTNLTKFKVWEIIGASPSREVRYERLDRIAALATGLGIPNIYTMSERYQAEDRWRSLHPLALEVFSPPDLLVKSSDPDRAIPAISSIGQDDCNAVLCYRTSVSRKLLPEILTQTLAEIVRHHEVLRLRDAGAHYQAATVDDVLLSRLVRYFRNVDGVRPEIFAAKIVSELATDIDRFGPAPLRVGVLATEESACELFLVAHRRFLDSESVALLAEDVCRVYEQLLSGKKPFLRAAQKTYSDYVHGHSATGRFSLATTTAPADAVSLEIALSIVSAAGISPGAGRRREATLRFLTATLRTLERVGVADTAVVLDPRVIDSSITDTLGALNCIIPWAHSPKSTDGPVADMEEVGARVEKLCAPLRPLASDVKKSRAVLINLEFLNGSAWMGAEEWTPKGFLIGTSWLPWAASMEILPVSTPEGTVVRVISRNDVEAKSLAQEIALRLDGEIATVVQESDSMLLAERFWQEELGSLHEEGQSRPELDSELYETIDVELASVTGHLLIDGEVLALPDALLAMYSLLLARVDATAPSHVMLLYQNGDSLHPFPLRLVKSGNPKCLDFIRIAGQKALLAAEHSKHSDDIFRKLPLPDFVRHGCICRQGSDAPRELEHLLNGRQTYVRELDTVLDPGSNHTARARIFFRPESIARSLIEDLALALPAALKKVLENPELRLSDLLWQGEQSTALEQVIRVPELSYEFQFGK